MLLKIDCQNLIHNFFFFKIFSLLDFLTTLLITHYTKLLILDNVYLFNSIKVMIIL